MNRTLLLLLGMAVTASAESAVDELVRGLGDDDASVREAAQARLRLFPADRESELRTALAAFSDPECHAAIARELDRRRLFPFLDRASRLIEAGFPRSSTPSFFQGPQMEDGLVDTLLLIATSPDYVLQAQSESTRGRCGDSAVVLRQFGEDWIVSLTGGVDGSDPGPWLSFLAERSALPTREIVSQSLEARGFPVGSSDANTAVHALIQALSSAQPFRAPGPGGFFLLDEHEGLQAPTRLTVVAWLVENLLPKNIPDLDDWMLANDGYFAWSEGKLVSVASLEDFERLVATKGAHAPKAALRALMREPERVDRSIWMTFNDDPDPVFRAMSVARGKPRWDEIGAVLEAAGDRWEAPELASLWEPDKLTRFLGFGRGNALQVRFALLALARNSPSRAALFARPCLRAVLTESPGASLDLAVAAASVLAAAGDLADVPDLDRWLSIAPISEVRSDLAFALVPLGSRRGLEYAAYRAANGTLGSRRMQILRAAVEGAPRSDSPDAWRSWGALDADVYQWDPEVRLWKVKP